MDKKGIVLIALAVVFAIGAGAAVYRYLGSVSRAQVIEPETVPVVVASKDLTFGTKLDKDALNLVDFPKASVPRGAYSSLDSVVGQTSKVFLVQGEPVLASKLSSVGGGLSVRVRPQMRAISLEINEVTGVSGFVLPGDRVDALVTIDNARGAGVSVTKTVLQNAEVLAAGTRTETKNNQNITVQAVTLLVDPPGAEALALGQHQGKIHFVLRNPVDLEVVAPHSTDTRQVLGLASAKDEEKPARVVYRTPAPKPEAKPAVAPPEPPTSPSFTVIRDGTIMQQAAPVAPEQGVNDPQKKKND